MTLAQILSLTGNEFQAMNYEDLAEVTKKLAEASRKRISRLPKSETGRIQGPAYQQLVNRALGTRTTPKSSQLNIKNGKVSISQKFKGKNKMSLSELRTLRKDLYNFLQNPTSTKTGYEDFKKRADLLSEQIRADRNKVIDLGDKYTEESLSTWNYFDQLITNSDFIYYGIEHLAWASTDIFNAIVASNGGVRSGKGYMNIDVNKMKEYVEKETDEYMSEMVSFFYDEED